VLVWRARELDSLTWILSELETVLGGSRFLEDKGIHLAIELYVTESAKQIEKKTEKIPQTHKNVLKEPDPETTEEGNLLARLSQNTGCPEFSTVL